MSRVAMEELLESGLDSVTSERARAELVEAATCGGVVVPARATGSELVRLKEWFESFLATRL